MIDYESERSRVVEKLRIKLLNINSIISLFLNKEIISYSRQKGDMYYYIFNGIYKEDTLLPKETRYLIMYGILTPHSGNFENSDYSYMLETDQEKLKGKIKELVNKRTEYIFDNFKHLIREKKLSKIFKE